MQGFVQGSSGGCSALGFSCTPQSSGIWVHDQTFVENCPSVLHFGYCFLEATGQEGQSLTDAEPGSLQYPNSSSGAVWQSRSLQCHIAAAVEQMSGTSQVPVYSSCLFLK